MIRGAPAEGDAIWYLPGYGHFNARGGRVVASTNWVGRWINEHYPNTYAHGYGAYVTDIRELCKQLGIRMVLLLGRNTAPVKWYYGSDE